MKKLGVIFDCSYHFLHSNFSSGYPHLFHFYNSFDELLSAHPEIEVIISSASDNAKKIKKQDGSGFEDNPNFDPNKLSNFPTVKKY